MPDEHNVAEPGGNTTAPASDCPPAEPPSRRRRTALIIGIAAALAAAAAAAIAVGSPASGPQYARPRNVCGLVTAATLAKYLPGPGYNPKTNIQTANPVSYGNAVTCGWFAIGGNLYVYINVYSSSGGGPGSAQQFFNREVQAHDKTTTDSEGRTTITGKRSVASLGDQATALLQTVTLSSGDISDWVDLFVRSGNAETEILYSISVPSAAQLPGAIAIARDVLADLPKVR